MSEHSPLPWVYDPATTGIENILDVNGGSILDGDEVPSLRNPADAAFIVRAVNCHDELVVVATDLLDVAEHSCHDHSENPDNQPLIRRARAILAKVKA